MLEFAEEDMEQLPGPGHERQSLFLGREGRGLPLHVNTA